MKQAQDTKPHEFCKTISEFALEYRTIRQRVLETKKRKENMKKRTKTRGKLITEVCEVAIHFKMKTYFSAWISLFCLWFEILIFFLQVKSFDWRKFSSNAETSLTFANLSFSPF